MTTTARDDIAAQARDAPARGRIVRISGPLIDIAGLDAAGMNEVVYVGHDRLLGEIVRLSEGRQSAQIYESSDGLHVGDPVGAAREPLSAELGPGLLGGVFDGIGRPLDRLSMRDGSFIRRGSYLATLDRTRAWAFQPAVQAGDRVEPGDVLGVVQETPSIEHRIVTPPHVAGLVVRVACGTQSVDETVVHIEGPEGDVSGVALVQRWPVRTRRPWAERVQLDEPLVTGQRVIDAFFPLAKGGTAIIPGGFGTGKTVLQQTLAKMADADIVVYVGCGERGNEMNAKPRSIPGSRSPSTTATWAITWR